MEHQSLRFPEILLGDIDLPTESQCPALKEGQSWPGMQHSFRQNFQPLAKLWQPAMTDDPGGHLLD